MSMEELFLKLVNMSITASWLVLAVVLFRVLLKKAPKYIRVLLWGLVGLRLLCPVSIESPYSLIMPEKTEAAVSRIMDDYVGPSSTHWDITSEYQTAVNSGIAPIYSETGGSYVVTGTTPTSEPTSLSDVLSVVWLIGMAVMALYAVFSYLRLKKKVAPSIAVTKQIYLCDYIDSPFILGVITPRIYLPSNMDPASAAHVLAHEQAHLKRRDHWWKPLGFALLTVYWFNPVIWLAYILLCRDIEMACDEKVVKELDAEHRKAYSEALLSCSVPRRLIAACPLAFGEVGVKDRIRSVLHYKKPAFWIILVAVIASVAVAVCFMTDPASVPLSDITTGAYREVESITVINGERTYEITTAEGITYVEELLGEVRVGKNEISQSRSEDRDKTNTIVLHLQNINTVRTYHFNADCSEVWFNDSVKPTMTYGVKNADLIRQFFESTIEEEASHLGSTDNATLSNITKENGFTILDQREREIAISIPTAALPDSIYSAEGHTFEKDEIIVYQTLTTTIYLDNIRFSNEGEDKLYFKFNIEYTFFNTGTLTLLHQMTEDGAVFSNWMRDMTLTDDETFYFGAVSIRGVDGNTSLTLYVDTEVCKKAVGSLNFTVAGFNDLTYARSGLEELVTNTRLTPGVYIATTSIYTDLLSSYDTANLPHDYRYEITDDGFTIYNLMSGDATSMSVDWCWKTGSEAIEALDFYKQWSDDWYILSNVKKLEDASTIKYQKLSSELHLTDLDGTLYLIQCSQDQSIWSIYVLVEENSSDYIFAPETPYQWASHASEYLEGGWVTCRDGETRPGTYALTEAEQMQLIEILENISEDAFVPGQSVDEYYVVASLHRSSLYSESFTVQLRYYNGNVDLVLYTDAKTSQTYQVHDETLIAYMESLYDPQRVDFYLTIWHWDQNIQYSYGYANISMDRIVGWEYEIIPYTDDTTPFGIRCRPEWVDEGWVFLSFLPNGFATCGTGLETVDNTFYTSPRQYNKTGYFDGSDSWSFMYYYNLPGAYVLYNEGADEWGNEYFGPYVEEDTFAQGIIGKDEVFALAKAYWNTENSEQFTAKFDYKTGVWTVWKDKENLDSCPIKQFDSEGNPIE